MFLQNDHGMPACKGSTHCMPCLIYQIHPEKMRWYRAGLTVNCFTAGAMLLLSEAAEAAHHRHAQEEARHVKPAA